MMLENKEAVIFDLDGTITDSMWVWADIDRTFFEQRKIPMPPTLNKEIEGMSFTETAEYFIRTLSASGNGRGIKRYLESDRTG